MSVMISVVNIPLCLVSIHNGTISKHHWIDTSLETFSIRGYLKLNMLQC